METKFTKTELIKAWLKRHPSDKASPDLEFNAVAGHVETNDGMFTPYRDWAYEKHGPLKPLTCNVHTDCDGHGKTCCPF